MPKIKLPPPVQFQFVVKMRVRKGTRPTRAQTRDLVETWIDSGAQPEGITISCIIWDGDKKRTITEIDDSSRGQVLQSILRRGLPRSSFRINPMGRN